MTEATTVERLRVLLDQSLSHAGQEPLGDDVDEHTFLPDVLDSIVLVGLVSMIEVEWDIEIDESEIELEVFADLASIATFVESETNKS